jgi:hypothetical protein
VLKMSLPIVQEHQESSETSAIMGVIERIALSPDADMAKLEKMLDMQERVMNRNARQAFTADLANMQCELPIVAKNGEGHNKAKYAKLEDINETIRPALQKFGFAVTFRVKQAEKSVTITAILSHKLGHSEETDLTLPLDVTGNKNAVQAVGSTVSYAKRYAIAALLNISTGDDTDGNFPPPEPRQKVKEPISDSRLNSAIEKIKSGDSSVDVLMRNFTLTPDQRKKLDSEVQQ